MSVHLYLAVAIMAAAPATSQVDLPSGGTDWGGGFHRTSDSKTDTPATSGAGPTTPVARAPAPAAPPSPPPVMTDWGGGYFKGGDSASVTPASRGASTAPDTSR